MKCGTCGRYANGICLLMDCETTDNKDACPEYIEGKRQTCGECKHLNKELAFCRACGAKWLNDSDGANCKYFEKVTVPTNGDVIRQGGDYALAHFKSEHRCDVCAYAAPIDTAPACRRPEGKVCFDGMLAWLNAPAESEGKDE